MDVLNIIIIIISGLAGTGAGIFLGIYLSKRKNRKNKEKAGEDAKSLVEDAKKEAESTLQKAAIERNELILKAKTKVEKENKKAQKTLRGKEKRITRREKKLEKLENNLENREKKLKTKEQSVSDKEKRVNQQLDESEKKLQKVKNELENITGMNKQEALKALEDKIISEARNAAVQDIEKIEEETNKKIDRLVKNIIITSIQRYASDYISERTVSVIPLPKDDMKGRIIGREGRNIRVFEAVTGVDVIIDDTPEAVVLSSFNPVRREVAKMALERLIADGRIHPTRIENIVEKCENDLNAKCKKEGEQIVFDMGLQKIHPGLLYHIGTLKYRSSYGQNLLKHSIETGYIAGVIASELNIGTKNARRAGLLHDIGKTVNHKKEGSHAAVGAILAKKYGESALIIQTIASHHNEVEPKSLLDHIVQIANQISAQRPGARKEDFASYIQRLEDLEDLCKSFKQVKKAYAIQSGREIRVMVENRNVNDKGVLVLAKDIAAKIENHLAYPGQIKVNVIRETRAVDYAK
ncbi:MAG: ribonuclease Y [Myxococcota bacterium]